MITNTHDKVKSLEEALLHLEGAHYALHDMVAFVLSKVPAIEVEELAIRLGDQVSVHADKIGEIRLAGYIEEVASVTDEVEHNRVEARGLLARFAGARRSRIVTK